MKRDTVTVTVYLLSGVALLWPCACKHTHTHLLTHTRTHTITRTQIHTHTHTYWCTDTHTHTHTHKHSHTHTYSRTHTHLLAHRHTHTHTHTHTQWRTISRAFYKSLSMQIVLEMWCTAGWNQLAHWFACVCVCVCVCVCACACVVSCLSCRLVSVSAYKAYYGLSVSLPHSSSAPQTADRHHFCFLFLFTTICSSETQLCRICPTALVQTRLARSPLSHTRTYTHTHTHTHTHTPVGQSCFYWSPLHPPYNIIMQL